MDNADAIWKDLPDKPGTDGKCSPLKVLSSQADALDEVSVYITSGRGRARYYARARFQQCYHQIQFRGENQAIRIDQESVRDVFVKDPTHVFDGVTNFLKFYDGMPGEDEQYMPKDELIPYMNKMFATMFVLQSTLKGSDVPSTIVFGVVRMLLSLTRKTGCLNHKDFKYGGFEDDLGMLVNYNNYTDLRDPWSRLIAANAAGMGPKAVKYLFEKHYAPSAFHSRVAAACRFLCTCAKLTPLGSVKALRMLKMPLFPVQYHHLEFMSKSAGFTGVSRVAREITIYLAEAAPLVEVAHGPLPSTGFTMSMLEYLVKDLNLEGRKGISVMVPVRLSLKRLKELAQEPFAIACADHLQELLEDQKFIWTDVVLGQQLAKAAKITPGLKDQPRTEREAICLYALEHIRTFGNTKPSEDASYRAPQGAVGALLNCYSFALFVTTDTQQKVRFSMTAILTQFAAGVFMKKHSLKTLDAYLKLYNDLHCPQMTMTYPMTSSDPLSSMESIAEALKPLLPSYAVRADSSGKSGTGVMPTYKLLSAIYPKALTLRKQSKQNKATSTSSLENNVTLQHPKVSVRVPPSLIQVLSQSHQ